MGEKGELEGGQGSKRKHSQSQWMSWKVAGWYIKSVILYLRKRGENNAQGTGMQILGG